MRINEELIAQAIRVARSLPESAGQKAVNAQTAAEAAQAAAEAAQAAAEERAFGVSVTQNADETYTLVFTPPTDDNP